MTYVSSTLESTSSAAPNAQHPKPPSLRYTRTTSARYDLGRFAESARFVRHYPEQNKVVREFLPSIQTPTLILAGEHDDLVPWSNNQFLADAMPNSVAHRLDAGHFAWEEAAGEYGRIVSEWIAGGYKKYLGS